MTATQTEFEYTDYTDPVSSAVEEVYYNDQTKELVVQLNSGHAYRYSNVPRFVYDTFAKGVVSAGHFYATNVKRDYGPGTYEGYDPFYCEVETHFDDEVPAPDMSSVAGPQRFDLSQRPVFTGKGLVETENTVRTFGLSAPDEPDVDRVLRHEVVFWVGDSEDEKTYNVRTDSVDDAAGALFDAAAALGVTVRVRRVTVHFE